MGKSDSPSGHDHRHLVAAMPPLTHDVEFFPDMDKTRGLSFMINTE